MLISWLRAKRAELDARRARALAEKRIAESLHDPWGTPSPEADEPDWIPISGAHFALPRDREAVLNKARDLFLRNAIARGIVETHVSFVIGEGFRLRASGDEARAEPVARELAALGPELRFTSLGEEAVRRFFRDGECIMRLFPQHQAVRFVEPETVASDDHRFPDGVETDPDDAVSVLRYHTTEHGPIDAAEILHLKHGVDANVPRGLPLLYPVFDRIRRFDTWLDDLGALIKVRTAVALVRKHQAAPSDVRAFSDSHKTSSATRAEGTLRLSKIRPGTVIDSSGIEYEFKSPNVDASDLGEYGRSVLLSVAAGVGLAEYMVSADASNNNYASIEVAESVPFERFRRFKAFFADAFAELARRMLAERLDLEGVNIACQPASLPVRDEANRVNALSLAHADAVMSKRTYAARLGLDYDEESRLIAPDNV